MKISNNYELLEEVPLYIVRISHVFNLDGLV